MSFTRSNISWLAAVLLALLAHQASAQPLTVQALTVQPTLLEFTGPLTDRSAEVSGLAWKDHWLVILPEDPTRFGHDDLLGLFVLDHQDILAAVEGTRAEPLSPRRIDCRAPGLKKLIKGFDGLEAVAIMGDRLYLAVEARRNLTMAGYLISGLYDLARETVTFDMTRAVSIPLAGNIFNIAEESLLIDGDQVISIGEANGLNITSSPVAKVFDDSLEYLGTIPFPRIEYRVTDATTLDGEGRFWVINYFFPPERLTLKPADDPEIASFGLPEGTEPDSCVERLLELRLTADDRIVRTGTPPIYLARVPGQDCRNWEGLARLGDRGFLLMTDKFPGTLLAFVPNPYTARKEP
jgi:hypothetical protein